MRRLSLFAMVLISVLANPSMAQRVVEVHGKGTVEAMPDYVKLSLLVSTVQPDRAQAKARIDQSVQSLLALTQRFAIHENDIDAAQLHNQPYYQWQQGERQYQGEQIRRNMVISVRSLNDFTAFSHALLTIDDVQLQGTEFVFNEPDALYVSALALAAQQAQTKAERLAAALNNRLGLVLSISEQGGARFAMQGMRALSMADSAQSEPAPMIVQAQTIEANIVVRYQLRQP